MLGYVIDRGSDKDNKTDVFGLSSDPTGAVFRCCLSDVLNIGSGTFLHPPQSH